jgi:hypothetical protein
VRLVAIVALATAVVAATVAQAHPSAPALRMVDRDPLTVLGTGFKPRERVVVIARGDMEPARVRVVASRLGRFRAQLRVAFDPCSGPEVIRAAGVKGSVALLKLSLRECPVVVIEP